VFEIFRLCFQWKEQIFHAGTTREGGGEALIPFKQAWHWSPDGQDGSARTNHIDAKRGFGVRCDVDHQEIFRGIEGIRVRPWNAFLGSVD
jgi:hypothetical protein